KSFPSYPLARTFDVSSPPSTQGIHSPCTSQSTNLDVGYPPTRTFDVSPPPSIQGLHSPCTSQPTYLDVGHTFKSLVALKKQKSCPMNPPVRTFDVSPPSLITLTIFDGGSREAKRCVEGSAEEEVVAGWYGAEEEQWPQKDS
ncbi:uncharacterized protein LOC109791475, partial [Cajanus cajan]|uniref:uncharacterized protein LOC109791475 n=1 Tax=Cajanus cajan TaxID=3821 RepID=UPI00098DB2B2